MDSRKLACAVAGLGRIASTLEQDSLREKPCTHIGAIDANPDCILTAGCDISQEARERFIAGRGGGDSAPAVFSSARDMLENTHPDILVIATWPESHLPITALAAAAGVPVVICEKPLAHTLRHARKLTRLHRSGKVKVLVNHERRYSADYVGVKKALASEKYGRLISVQATLFFGRNASHRDVLLHDGTHMADIISFLCGSPLVLNRRSGSMKSSVGSSFLFGDAGGVPVVLEVGAERDHLVFEIALSCETGRIRVGNALLAFEKSVPSPYYEKYRSLVPDDTPEIGKTGYFAHMVEDAVRCCRDKNYSPVSSAVEGLRAMQFIRSFKARR